MNINAEPANDEHPEANGENNSQTSPPCRASIARCSISQGQGLAREDAVEPCPQGGLALRGRMLAIGFEIAIEPPDQRARSALSLALFIREGVELVNEALGMDPAQAMRADVELPGVIADAT